MRTLPPLWPYWEVIQKIQKLRLIRNYRINEEKFEFWRAVSTICCFTSDLRQKLPWNFKLASDSNFVLSKRFKITELLIFRNHRNFYMMSEISVWLIWEIIWNSIFCQDFLNKLHWILILEFRRIILGVYHVSLGMKQSLRRMSRRLLFMEHALVPEFKVNF